MFSEINKECNLKLKTIVILGTGLFVMGCSPSASQLKKVMASDPTILQAAIEADPKGFFETIRKVQGKAQEQAMAQQMDDEFKRVKTEMASPKEVKIEADRAILGSASAAVTIVEWADFNCGHCSSAAATMKKISETYGDKVRIVFKHLPILAPESRTAAEYMEAIALQNKEQAIKFHALLFERQRELREGGVKFLKSIAKEVGADIGKVEKDAKGSAVKARIDSDVAEAKKFEFNGTPGFMINGAGIHGAYPEEFFKKVIDSVLGESKS